MQRAQWARRCSGRIELQPGAEVAISVMPPMPTEWWLRPVSNACRVGEQSAVVWNRLYRRPLAARFSRFGVRHRPPKTLDPPNPTSPRRLTRTFGVEGRIVPIRGTGGTAAERLWFGRRFCGMRAGGACGGLAAFAEHEVPAARGTGQQHAFQRHGAQQAARGPGADGCDADYAEELGEGGEAACDRPVFECFRQMRTVAAQDADQGEHVGDVLRDGLAAPVPWGTGWGRPAVISASRIVSISDYMPARSQAVTARPWINRCAAGYVSAPHRR